MMINNICNQIKQRLVTDNEKRLGDTVLLQISAQYAGLWLEHAYDAVIYAKMDNSKLYLARNTIEAFIDHQKDGLYPFRVVEVDGKAVYEYSQIQECMALGRLCLDDPDFQKIKIKDNPNDKHSNYGLRCRRTRYCPGI